MTRSFLYVPADRPNRLAGALTRGADAVIADLEDGVARTAKDAARVNATAWLEAAVPPTDPAGGVGRPEQWVRINGDDRTIGDLDAVIEPNLSGIVLPKATLARLADLEETIAYLEQERGIESLSVRFVALLESAQGLLDAVELAAHPRVDRLAIGEFDLAAELGIDPRRGIQALWPLRTQLVVASAAAAIAAPVGPVYADIRDVVGLRSASHELAAAGFGAGSAIHPDQILPINEVFSPSPEDIAWAEELIAEFAARTDDGLGVFTDANGSMVDEAVVRRARRIVASVRPDA